MDALSLAAGEVVRQKLEALVKGLHRYFVCYLKEDNELVLGSVSGPEASYDDLLNSLKESASSSEGRPWSYGIFNFSTELRPQRKIVVILWCPDRAIMKEQNIFTHVFIVSINAMLNDFETKVHVYVQAAQPSDITEKSISAAVDRVDCVK